MTEKLDPPIGKLTFSATDAKKPAHNLSWQGVEKGRNPTRKTLARMARRAEGVERAPRLRRNKAVAVRDLRPKGRALSLFGEAADFNSIFMRVGGFRSFSTPC